MKLCECGCGRPTPIATRTRYGNVKGEPTRRLHGHSRKRRKSAVEFLYEDRGYVTPCRIWRRATSNGYGYRWVDGRNRRVHVVEWERVHGPVPEGYELDHLCRQRACAELAHLELVTRAENLRRGAGTKLTYAQVAEIRRSGGQPAALAERFGVDSATIRDIYAGRTWAAAASSGESEERNTTMTRDDETGVDPVASDGEPNDDEVTRRRRKRHAEGASIAERAESGDLSGPADDQEEDDGQFAMGLIESQLPVSLARLIPRGMPIEVKVAMGSAEVPGKGLFGIDEDITLVVRCRPGKYELPTIRGEGDKTERMKVRQVLKVLYVARAGTDHARTMISEAEARAPKRANAG